MEKVWTSTSTIYHLLPTTYASVNDFYSTALAEHCCTVAYTQQLPCSSSQSHCSTAQQHGSSQQLFSLKLFTLKSHKTAINHSMTYREGASASECLIQTDESSCAHWRDAEEDKTVVVLATTSQQHANETCPVTMISNNKLREQPALLQWPEWYSMITHNLHDRKLA